MRRAWRFQFGIRTLLLAALILPPIIAMQYRKWREYRTEYQTWGSLFDARQRRDSALADWRVAYGVSEANESNAEQRYFAARQDFQTAYKNLRARYRTDEELLRANERATAQLRGAGRPASSPP